MQKNFECIKKSFYLITITENEPGVAIDKNCKLYHRFLKNIDGSEKCCSLS